MNDLLKRFREITDRAPLRVPVPAAVAQFGVDENKLVMLQEENIVRGRNELDFLGLTATPLDEGLRKLADAMREVLPEEGVGKLEHKHFWADITGSRFNAVQLMARFRERVNDFMPIEFVAEPGAPDRIEKGATLTGSLPMRGHFQVRVEVAEPARVVFGTVEGHPLAGIVEFSADDVSKGVRFTIHTYTRASNVIDWVAMRTLGSHAQAANWRVVVERIIDASGGTSDGIREETESLDGARAERVEEQVKQIVQERKREETKAAAALPHS
jgi:NADH dehydrogenase